MKRAVIKQKYKTNTTNLIHIIICLKFNSYYIEEKNESLKTRINQHLKHIKKLKPFEKYHDKEVARH